MKPAAIHLNEATFYLEIYSRLTFMENYGDGTQAIQVMHPVLLILIAELSNHTLDYNRAKVGLKLERGERIYEACHSK